MSWHTASLRGIRILLAQAGFMFAGFALVLSNIATFVPGAQARCCLYGTLSALVGLLHPERYLRLVALLLAICLALESAIAFRVGLLGL